MATRLRARDPHLVTPGKPKILIFGPPGAGKTWFALSFPRPYLIDTEGGADMLHYQKRLLASGGSYMGPADGALDFDTIMEQIRALSTEKHSYQTFVLDSLTKVYQHSIAHEAERLGSKDAFGASKKPAIGQMRRLVAAIQRLDMACVFIAHETSEWGTVDGQRQEIGKCPDVWEKMRYELHLALHIRKMGKGQREAVVDKSRLIGFPEFDRFYLQRNGEECGYAEFSERYGKDYIETESTPIVLASAEQVAEIRRLLDVVRVPDTDVEKILTKAGVDSWEEVTTEQASKSVDWLLSKIKKESA